MRFDVWLMTASAIFTLAACSQDIIEDTPIPPKINRGLDPQIFAGDIPPAEKAAVSKWINEAVALLKSPAFETNFARASVHFPDVYVSKTEDIISSSLLMKRLKTQDPRNPDLWWPKTFVVLDGEAATRTQDRFGFGFEGSRKATAGPHPKEPVPQKTGQIEIGRLHLARYTQGDVVEKSCALNTMVHEISHTLSEKPDRYWMHILDSQRGITPPRGIFEASYFIGIVAQCTYLEDVGRIDTADFETCLLTFSDPSLFSRFRSLACDDFPDTKPISPLGWLRP